MHKIPRPLNSSLTWSECSTFFWLRTVVLDLEVLALHSAAKRCSGSWSSPCDEQQNLQKAKMES